MTKFVRIPQEAYEKLVKRELNEIKQLFTENKDAETILCYECVLHGDSDFVSYAIIYNRLDVYKELLRQNRVEFERVHEFYSRAIRYRSFVFLKYFLPYYDKNCHLYTMSCCCGADTKEELEVANFLIELTAHLWDDYSPNIKKQVPRVYFNICKHGPTNMLQTLIKYRNLHPHEESLKGGIIEAIQAKNIPMIQFLIEEYQILSLFTTPSDRDTVENALSSCHSPEISELVHAHFQAN